MDKNFAKVRLSAEEMRLVRDPAWILTKNSVMGKVVGMFAELSERARGGAIDIRREGSAGWMGGPHKEPKISRGENYKGLPWVMLDYPRVFGKEDVCAIRTFFWWGHAFSVMLHLKGVYRERFLPTILARRGELAAAGFEMSVSGDEWAHEHTGETYGPIRGMETGGGGGTGGAGMGDDAGMIDGPGAIGGRLWLKLSARVELEHWDEAPERLSALHGLLMEVLSNEDHR